MLLFPHFRASTPYGSEATSPLTGLGLKTEVLPALCRFTAVVVAREARAGWENLNFLAYKKELVAGTARKKLLLYFLLKKFRQSSAKIVLLLKIALTLEKRLLAP